MARKPTSKQARATAYRLDHPKSTLSEAMRHAHYSESTIDNPTRNFTGLKGTKTLAEQLQANVSVKVSAKRIANKIDALMDAKKIHSSVTERDRVVDDNATQLKATELAIRIYTILEEQGGDVTNNNLFITDDQLHRLIGQKN